MMSSNNDAQPATVPMMMGVELGTDWGDGAGTLGAGTGTVVVLVALPDAGGAVAATLVGGAVGSTMGGTTAVTVWQTGSDGETSHVGTD